MVMLLLFLVVFVFFFFFKRKTAYEMRISDWSSDVCASDLGAWSADLGTNGVEPVKGQMLLLGGEPGALTRACIGDDVYLIPRRDGKILAGSTLEHQGFDLSLSETVRDDLHQRAKRIWPGVGALPVIGHWAGLRPYANRDAPLLEAVEGQSGLYVATGHYRLGITLAPASAMRIEKLLRL